MPSSQWPDGLRGAPQRIAAIRAFAEGIAQNDAEAIDVGWQGKAGWDRAVAKAESSAAEAVDPYAFGLVLRTLYASYPSLHSRVDLRADIDYRIAFGAPYMPFTMKVEELGPDDKPRSVLISAVVSTDAWLLSGALAVGDRVIAANGEPIATWLSRATKACRRNSKWQCYDDFDKQFRNGLLGWDPRLPLHLGIIRDGKKSIITYTPEVAPERTIERSYASCGEDGSAYKGFMPVYQGWNLCVFKSVEGPPTEIWRLKSFHYPTSASIGSPREEVETFWNAHWSAVSPKIRSVIIDLSGNGGGDIPLAWYSLLFDRPYQEQYAQYRWLSSYDDPSVLNELPDDPAHARWLADLVARNPDARHEVGSYLPPVPMFCSDEDAACEGRLVPPKSHGFTGKVALILDDNCVSSCSGFSWNIVTKLGSRAAAFGLPDSGDSNFMRLPLKLYYRDGGWYTAIGASAVPDEKPIATANVMVTRTTTDDGKIISGQSVSVRRVVARRWDDSANSWAERVIGVIRNSLVGPEQSVQAN